MDEDVPPQPPPAVPLSRAFAAGIDDVSVNRRSVTARINTGTVDRYRTVVPPSGGDFKNFMRSPAVLWEHGEDPTRGRQPIGHATSVKFRRADNDLLAVTQFKQDEYSERIFQDYLSGVLTAFSIDFLPDLGRSSAPTSAEIRMNPSWADAHTVYRAWELTGYSAVSYPGNPEALALAVERGLWVPDDVRSLLPAIVRQVEPEAEPEAEPTPETPTLPVVRTYTQAELSAAISRAAIPVALALLDRRLRDRDDLARGRV
jgi:hypothetical protein